jgi:hypothetical protein
MAKTIYETFTRTIRKNSTDAALYVAFERCGIATARSSQVCADVDLFSQYVQAQLIVQNPLGSWSAYSEISSRIWHEIIPTSERLTTHFLQVGHKYSGKKLETFLCVPICLKHPQEKKMMNVIAVSGYVFSTVSELKRIPERPINVLVRQSYYQIILQSLFTGVINVLDLVQDVELAATTPAFRVFSLEG